MLKLVLLRHGESQWNKENRFTGWTDVDLSEKGIEEASKAGRTLKENGFVDGEFYDKDAITQIATIPSREVLISKFLGSIQSPITNFARVLAQIAENKPADGAAAPAEEAASAAE